MRQRSVTPAVTRLRLPHAMADSAITEEEEGVALAQEDKEKEEDGERGAAGNQPTSEGNGVPELGGSCLAVLLEDAWQRALDRRGEETLASLLAPGCVWKSPSEECIGKEAILTEVRALAEFFGAPRIEVRDTTALPSTTDGTQRCTAEWSFSGSWPAMWNPRVRITGTSQIEYHGEEGDLRIQCIDDAWQSPKDMVSLFLGQVLPRLNDLINLYNTPHAEFSDWYLVEAREDYEVFQAQPHLTLQVSRNLDPTEPADQIASFLPDAVFGDEMPTRGLERDPFIAVSPVTISTEVVKCPAFGDQDVRRVTWALPVASELGQGRAARRALPRVAVRTEEPDWMEVHLRYVQEPGGLIAVRRFANDDTISTSASKARQDLLTSIERDGWRPSRRSENSGRPVFQYLQNTVKAGWRPQSGHLAIAAHIPQPDQLQPNYIAIHIEQAQVQ